MKKRLTKGKDHPEIKEIKNICGITPDTAKTKTVCHKLKKVKKI